MKIVVLDGYTLCPGDLDMRELEEMGIPREYTDILTLLCHKEGVPYKKI